MVSNGQRMWDEAIALAREIHANIKRQDAERKAAALARRRARHAQLKASGALSQQKAAPAYNPEPPSSCYCFACRMPPCGWCENGGGAHD